MSALLVHMNLPLSFPALRAAAGGLDRLCRWCVLHTIAFVLVGFAATSVGLRAQTVSTFASGLTTPCWLAFDPAGNLYVADYTASVYKITPAGGISAFASGFTSSSGLAFDAAGNLYVADRGPGRNTVSKVTPSGVVSLFASGFSNPAGLAFDPAGNLYVANFGSGTVSQVTSGGVVSTFASGVSNPTGLVFNTTDNNLYVGDYTANNVRKITPLGVVSTFASGFSRPYGLAFDTVGNLYVATYGAGSVRKVSPGGVISTIATGFSSPVGVALDTASNLYLANFMGTTVSKVTLTAPTVTTPTHASIASAAGTTATLGGNVTSDGGATITARGVVYSVTATNPNPKLTDADATNVVGTGTTGTFTVSATGLTAGTGYSYAAYATNSRGTTYSSVGTFTPLSTDATLSAFALSAGTLAPAFAPGTTSYTASVANGTTSLTVTPTTTQASGTITVNGTTVASAAASGAISLNVGANTITTIVTAQDGTTTKTYTVTVTRMTTVDFIARQTPSASVSHAAALTYRVTFGTAVSGVTAGNFDLSPAVTGSSVSSVTAIGGAPATQWNVVVNTGSGDGALTLRLANATGLSIPVSTPLPFADQSYTIDKTAPTTTAVAAAFSADTGASSTDFVTRTAAQTISGTLDAVLMAGESVDVSLDNGTTWATAITSVGTNTWSLAAQTLTASNTLNVRVADTAGNTGPVFQQSYVLDTTAPTIAIGAPSAALAAGGPITFTVTYADTHFHASTLVAGDITLNATGGASATIAVSGTGASRTVTLSGLTGNGTLGISIAAGTASDIAGNLAAASGASATVTIDNTAPTVSTILRQAPATVNTSAASATYRVTFNESVTGVDAADFALTVVSGTPSGTIGTVTPVSTSVYDVAVNALAGQGQLRLDLKASGTGIADLAGNAIGGGFSAGDFYAIGATNVFDSVSLAAGTARDVSHATTAKVAQRFTTSAAAPLTLVSVMAAIGTVTGTPVPSVTIQTDSSGTPGTVVATLTNPASLTANVLNTWTGRAVLSASTTYWIVFSDTSVAGAYEIKATAATTGGSGDWLTNSDYAYRSGANAATGPQAGALRLAFGANNVPAITSSLAASATYGSAIGTYTITATHSPTSYNATGLPAGLSVDTNTGQITGTPTTTTGSPFSITLSATNGDGTDTATLVLTVAQAALTVTGVTASDKTYDGATTATLATGSAALAGLVNGDTPTTVVLASGSATGAFADRHVGPGKIVTVAGLSISGASATHYTLTQPTTTASIAAKTLTASGLAASDKVYNGTPAAILTGTAALQVAAAVGSGSTSDGRPYTGDLVTLGGTATGAFADRHVGTTKAVTVTGLTLSGAESTNYSLAQPAGLTATVTAKALTASGLAASAKVYDGTTVAALTGTAVFLAPESAGAGNTSDGKPYDVDSVNTGGTATGAFADRHVGTGKAITVTGITVAGTGSGNYTATQPARLSAEVTAKALTVAGVSAVATRIYDGTTAAGLTGTASLLATEAAGSGTTGDGKPYAVDTLSLGGAATGTFADRNVASNKAITVAGLTLGSTDAANYSLVQPAGLTGAITAKALTVAGLSGGTRVYDATLTAPLTGTAALLAAEPAGAGDPSDGKPYTVDSVTLGGTAAGVFADRHADTGKAITVTGLTLGSTDAGNYTVTPPTGLTGIVTVKALTVSGVTASAKVYDATVAATLTGMPVLQSTEAPGAGTTADGKPYTGDPVSLTGTMSGAFADRHAATGKTVTVSGLSLTGAEAANYSVAALTATADITAKALTIGGVTASNKIYDATTTAPLGGTAALAPAEAVGAGSTDDGIPYDLDTVNLATTASGVFADKEVGTLKAITVSGLTLGGAQAANYSPTQPTGLIADVTAKALTASGLAADHRIYDGTTVATLSGTAVLPTAEAPGAGTTVDGQPYTGDAVSLSGTAAGDFADRHVATAKAVTVSGLTLSGAQSANYSLTPLTGLTADVTVKVLTTSGVASPGKIYDGTTVAPLSGLIALQTAQAPGAGTTSDGKPYTGDTVNVSGTAVGAFADRHVGPAKAIAITGLTLGGSQASNYSVTPPTGVTAPVTAKALTLIGVTGTHRIYDATTTATLTGTAALQTAEAAGTGTAADGKPYTGDALSLGGTPAATFATKTVGTAKPITVTGYTLGDAQAGDYTLTQPAGLTANVTAKALTVSGAVANSKAYDGNTVASLAFAGATLVGVMTADAVTLVTSGATGTFASTNAAAGQTVTIAGLALGGTDAINYTLTQPSATASITPAGVQVALGNLSHVYDGSPKSASVTAAPSVPVSVSYGGGIAPTNAGSYSVSATVIDSNYTGAAHGTLVIAKAAQTVNFAAPGSATVGVPLTLSATASSGLPVTFSVVSGSASLAGTALTVDTAGSVTVRASQAGNENFLPASADLTLVNVAKLAQTIAFAVPADKRANDPAFALSATASSGLPVSFAIVNGPAMLTGGTVTLTGAAGTVTVRASQPGNTVYAPAPDVTRTFEVIQVGPKIYFGSLGGNGMAAQIDADGKNGTMIGIIPGTGEGFVVNFTLDASGQWFATVITFTGATTAGVSGDLGRLAALKTELPGEPKPASASFTRTFRGSVVGSTLSGTIDGLGISFSAALVPPTGPTAPIAGYYQSSSLRTATGNIYSIVGPDREVYVLAITPDYVGGNSGTAAVNGTFSVTTAGQTTINGSVDAPTTIVEGTLSRPGQPAEAFAGLAVTTLRTDRLLNLSSRARVDGAVSQLITGFVIGGTEPKTVLLRAIGPALGSFGISGALPAAQLRLFDGQGKLLREIDGWRDDPTLARTFARVGAFALGAPNGDSALVATLAPGAYTMQVVPVAAAGGSSVGVGLAEIYDASPNPHAEYQRLVNISSRGTIESGEGVLIGGFVVAGNAPKRLLVRGVGPALAAFGVAGALADPQLTVYDRGTVLARNDNWGTPTSVNTAQVAATPNQISAAEVQVGAFRYGAGGRDAAVIVTLAPGAYTAHVVGATASATGTALIEIYELPLN